MVVISAHGKLGPENGEFESSLCYKLRLLFLKHRNLEKTGIPDPEVVCL